MENWNTWKRKFAYEKERDEILFATIHQILFKGSVIF